MTRRIQTPDGTIHEFPDTATDEQISQALSGSSEQARIAGMSQGAKEYAKSLQGAQNMSTGIAGEAQQGATLGFTDELNALGLAGLDYARNKLVGRPMEDMVSGKGQTFSDLYNDYIDAQRIAQHKFEKLHPYIAGTAKFVGGLASGTPAAGAAVAPMTTAQAMKTGALYGGAYGAAQGFGSSEGGLGNRLTGAAVGGGTGAALGAAIPGALSLFSKAPQTSGVTQDLQQAGSAIYESPEYKNLTISGQAMQNLSDELHMEALKFGTHPKIHPGVSGALDAVSEKAGLDQTLPEIDVLRRIIRNSPSTTNRSEGELASNLISKLDDFVANLTPQDVVSGDPAAAQQALTKARDLWSRYRKSDLIETVLENADIGAGSTGTGGNLDNKTRQALAKLLTNKKTANLWDDQERQMILAASKGEPLQNLLRSVGRFSPKGNALTATLEIMMGPHLGMPVAAVGMGAKALADRATQQNAQRLLSLVQTGQLTPQAMAQLSPQMQALARAMMMEGTQQATQRVPPLIGAPSQ